MTGLGEDVTVRDETVAKAGEEAEAVKTLPTPVLPSKSERDAHRVTHCPYRSWCEDCRAGCGLEAPHSLRDQEARKIPIVGFDYMFIGKRRAYIQGEKMQDGDAVDNVLKVLVVRCHKSKALFAHPVPQKGLDEKGYAIECMVKDIVWLGYPRFC